MDDGGTVDDVGEASMADVAGGTAGRDSPMDSCGNSPLRPGGGASMALLRGATMDDGGGARRDAGGGALMTAGGRASMAAAGETMATNRQKGRFQSLDAIGRGCYIGGTPKEDIMSGGARTDNN